MNKIFIIIFLMATSKSFCMDKNNSQNGVWIKTSKSKAGWNTIIGPDIVIINNKRVKTIFLHTGLEYEYELINDKLILKSDSDTINQTISLDENGLMKLFHVNYEFFYFRIQDTKNCILPENLKKEILGKWFLNETKTSYFLFKDLVDIDTGENIMNYNLENGEKEGRWSIFSLNGFVLLELNMIDFSERRLIVVEEVEKLYIKNYYITSNSVKKEIVLSK